MLAQRTQLLSSLHPESVVRRTHTTAPHPRSFSFALHGVDTLCVGALHFSDRGVCADGGGRPQRIEWVSRGSTSAGPHASWKARATCVRTCV